MGCNKYIGARYVPKFDGTYDATKEYEALTVVDNGAGTTYITKKPTPANTPLSNGYYWAVYGSENGALIDLENRMGEVERLSAEPYAPVIEGQFTFTSVNGNTKVNYVKIDKQYKPRLVLAGENVKESGEWVIADVGEMSLREKATAACNASTIHSNLTTAGTIIVDGVVKHVNDINYAEWGSQALENLYMTEDGQLNVIDAFASVSAMQALNPVWSFQGWQKIVEDGVINDTVRRNVYAPHTIIAQDYDGNYLLMATGGRRLDNFGMNYDEIVAAIGMLDFNVRIAYDCDGGGSSAVLAHQIRQNDVLENDSRAVLNAIVFDIPAYTYSDYQSGYSEYLANVRARVTSPNVPYNALRIVGNVDGSNKTVGIEYYTQKNDGYDKFTYERALKFGFSDDAREIYLDALRSDNRYLNAMKIKDSDDSVIMLGREVFRATTIKRLEAEVTSNASGVVDSNAMISGGLSINNYFVLQAMSLSDAYYVVPHKYGSRYTFLAYNASDDTRAANVTFTIRVLAVDDPKTTT